VMLSSSLLHDRRVVVILSVHGIQRVEKQFMFQRVCVRRHLAGEETVYELPRKIVFDDYCAG
jgi:hypothetical protein